MDCLWMGAKQASINDVSLLGKDIKEPGDKKVLSQEISTRVVHLQPQSKKDYLNLSTISWEVSLTTSNSTFHHNNCGHFIVDFKDVNLIFLMKRSMHLYYPIPCEAHRTIFYLMPCGHTKQYFFLNVRQSFFYEYYNVIL